MKILCDEVKVQTGWREQFLDVTSNVVETLGKAGIRNGFINIMSCHTTAGLFLDEFREALLEDIKAFLARLVGPQGWYRHNSSEFSDCERRNAVSHLRGIILFSRPLTLQVCDGELVLGSRRIIFADLDGPRARTLQIQVIGE